MEGKVYKVKFNGICRLLAAANDYDSFLEAVLKAFNIEKENVKNLKVSYKDSEKDIILVDNDDDYKLMLKTQVTSIRIKLKRGKKEEEEEEGDENNYEDEWPEYYEEKKECEDEKKRRHRRRRFGPKMWGKPPMWWGFGRKGRKMRRFMCPPMGPYGFPPMPPMMDPFMRPPMMMNPFMRPPMMPPMMGPMMRPPMMGRHFMRPPMMGRHFMRPPMMGRHCMRPPMMFPPMMDYCMKKPMDCWRRPPMGEKCCRPPMGPPMGERCGRPPMGPPMGERCGRPPMRPPMEDDYESEPCERPEECFGEKCRRKPCWKKFKCFEGKPCCKGPWGMERPGKFGHRRPPMW